MFKERWFDLEDEGCGRGTRAVTVLYTSKAGLEALVKDLERIRLLDSDGRFEVDIDGVDKIFDVPFTHVDIRQNPLSSEDGNEKEDDESWKKTFKYIAACVLVVGFLSMYGLVRLAMDIIQ